MDMEPDPKPFTVQQGRPVYGMPDPPRPRRSRLILVGVPVLAVFTGFAAIVWMAYEGGAGSPAGEPPLIKAATSPIKLSPDQARGSDVAEEEGGVRELLSDIPFEQQLERLLPDLEEPMRPPAPVERAESSPQPAPEPSQPGPSPGQMAAVDLPSPDQAEPPAEPPAAELAPAPQDTESPEPARSSRQSSEPATAATESQEQTPSTTAQAPRPGPSRPAPPTSAESEPTAQAALDALIAEVSQAPASQPDRRPDATGSRAETTPPAGRSKPSTSSTTRPRDQQMAATTPSEPLDRSSTGREEREPLITTAPGESQSGSASGYRVQLAAVREQADARRAWNLFMLDLGPILSRYQPYFERANTANGIFYRVQVGPFASAGDAETVCDELKQRNASCFVVRR